MAYDFQIKLGAIIDDSTMKTLQTSIDKWNSKISLKIKLDIDDTAINSIKAKLEKINLDVGSKVSPITSLQGAQPSTPFLAKSTQTSKSQTDVFKQLGATFDTTQVKVGEEVVKTEYNYESALKRTQKAQEQAAKAQEKLNIAREKDAQKAAKAQEKANQSLIKSQQKLTNETDNYKSRLISLKNSGALTKKEFASFNTQLSQLQTQLKSGDITTEQFVEKFRDLKRKTSETSSEMMTFGERTKTAFSAMTQWMTATTIFFALVRSIKDVLTQVKALDKALVELNKVSDLTESGMAKVTDEAFKLGKQTARTGTEVLAAITEFKRAGFELEQSQTLAKYAIMLTNVADGITDTGEAAKVFISILKGANKDISYASTLLDELNAISNTSAVSFDALASMVQSSAGTMHTLGNSIEETTALVTGAYEVLQDDRVAKGISVIGLRLSGLNEDMEEEAGLASKLGDALKTYAGIDVMGVDGQLRSTYDILKDLAVVYPKLTKNAQAYLLTEIAGKNRADVLASVLTNWQGVSKAMDTAANSAGSAEKEQAAYLDSIEAKIAQLKNTWQELATSVLSSDLVKGVIDFADWILKVVNATGGLKTTLLGIASLIVLIKGQAIFEFLGNTWKSIKSVASSLIAMKTAAQGATLAMNALKLSLGAIMLVLTAVVAIVSAANKAEEERLQTALDNIEVMKEEKQQLANLKEEYVKLSAVEHPSETQANRLKAIREELIKTYGKEAEVLDFLNGKYDENTEKLRGLEKRDLLRLQQESDVALEGIKKQLLSKQEFFGSATTNFAGIGSFLAETEKMRDDPFKLFNFYQDEYDKLLAKQKEEGELSKDETSKLKGLKKELDEQRELVQQYTDLLDQNQQIIDRIEFIDKGGQERVDKLSQNIAKFLTLPVEEQIKAMGALESEIGELEKTEDYAKNKEDIDKVTEAFKQQAETIKNTDFALDQLSKNLSALKELKTQEDEELKTQEKLLAVEKAREELAKAKEKRISAYRLGKGIVSVEDTSSIQKAQEDLNKAIEEASGTKTEQAIAQIEELQKIYDKAQSESALGIGKKVDGKTIRETFLDPEVLAEFAKLSVAEKKLFLEQFLSLGSWSATQEAETKAKQEELDKWLPKYANGTASASGGVSMVGEQGAELRVLNKGDGIIDSNTTRNLITLGQNPKEFIKSVTNGGANNSNVINVDKVIYDGNDYQGFLSKVLGVAMPTRPRTV